MFSRSATSRRNSAFSCSVYLRGARRCITSPACRTQLYAAWTFTPAASAAALTLPSLSSSSKNCAFCSLLYFGPDNIATLREVLQRLLEPKLAMASSTYARSRMCSPTASSATAWARGLEHTRSPRAGLTASTKRVFAIHRSEQNSRNLSLIPNDEDYQHQDRSGNRVCCHDTMSRSGGRDCGPDPGRLLERRP